MTAPEASSEGTKRPDPGRRPALFVRTDDKGSIRLETIKKRRDFVAASRARRSAARSVILQGRKRKDGEPAPAQALRVGYTCSKKVGNAVARNRAKRRLRAAATDTLPRLGRPGWDYVLIGRSGATADRPFVELIADLETAIAAIHTPREMK